jgi:hypothetical protein
VSGARETAAARLRLVRRSARLERLRARAPRYLFVAALAILCLAGLRAIVVPAQSASGEGGTVVVDNAAQEFAQRFARAYLTYDAARPDLRERLLRSVVPSDFDPGASTTAGRGSQRVLWTEIATNQEAIAGGRVIVVAAGVSSQKEPIYLSVPVARLGGALGVTAYPSIVGPPVYSRAPLPERAEVEDREVLAVAKRAIANYLAGEMTNLNADLARGTLVSPPSPSLELRSVDDVVWAAGEGSSAVLVTVSAADERRALWTLSYEIGVARERGRAVVTFIETVPTDP